MYFWDLDYGFAGVVLIKKIGDGLRNIQGCWDSIHVIEIQEKVYFLLQFIGILLFLTNFFENARLTVVLIPLFYFLAVEMKFGV